MAKAPTLYYPAKQLNPDQQEHNRRATLGQPGYDPNLSATENETASRMYWANPANQIVRYRPQPITHFANSPGISAMRRLLRMGGRRSTVLASSQPHMTGTALTAGMVKASGS